MLDRNFPTLSRFTALGLIAGLTFTTVASAQAPAPAAPPAKPAPSAPAAPPPAASTAPAQPAPAATPAAPTAKPAAVAPAVKEPSKRDRDAARKAFADGEKAFAKADYVAAHAAFEKANTLVPTPQAEYWLAKTIDLQNQTPEAIAAYERFLANPEAASVGEDKLSEAKLRLEQLQLSQVAVIELTTLPANTEVTVDGVAQPNATPLVLKLTPGPHKITLSAAGYEPKELDVEARAGTRQAETIELALIPPPPPPPAPPPPAPAPPPPPAAERSLVPAYVTLGIAGAGAVVGTIFGLKALSSKNDFDDNPTRDAADDTERNALIADMAFGVAITLGVTGIVLLTTDEGPPADAAAKVEHPKLKRSRAKLEVLPYASPTSGGAAAKLTF